MRIPNVVLLVAFTAVISAGLATAITLAVDGSRDSGSLSSAADEDFPLDPEATDEPVDDDPVPANAEPDGEYSADCDLTLDPYFFTADASIDNTGNIGAVYRLDAEWYLTGGDTVKSSKQIRVQPGMSARVGIKKPSNVDEAGRNLDYDAGDDCKAEVSIVRTFGEPQ